ncbi:MAG: FAD-dependent oxidoreductase, partial [Rhodothermales bacterium]
MTIPGTEDQPLRVAIIGAGPAAFYAADYLLKQDDLSVEVDMFDRLPTPFGLVRGGVAPDHQNIKNVARVFHKTALKPGFRFFGNVEFGTDILLEDLRAHYHQIFYATGAQTDRSLGIPGEELDGSHSATEFVAWYNGHPDYRHLEFDLSAEKVVVVGVGNVAVDVARILCRTPEELAQTDIADYALDALRESNVQDVYMLGRRGPLQAAFTPPEVKELGEMEDADVVVLPDEAELDALSAEDLDAADRNTRRNVEIVQEFAARRPEGKPNRLHIR